MRKMKDSGIQWIGQIPENWETKRLKALFEFGKGLPITKENLKEKGIPVISYGQIHSKTNSGVKIQDDLIRYVEESYLSSNPSSLVHKGDFIFADTSEDLEGCGNCVFIDEEITLFAGYHTIIFKVKTENNNRYLAYLFKTDNWRSQIRSKVTGVKLFSISRKILSESSVLLPPLAEQARIADFLDQKCSAIDSVLEKTKASIEEYKKLKQSIITQAVTKGLQPNRQMKDSGIDYIGYIPEGWKTIKLRYIGSPQNGISKGAEYFGEGYPFVSYSDVYKNMELPSSVKGLVQSTDDDRKTYSVKRGDIFFTRTSETIEEIGFTSVCLNTIENATFAGFLIRVRPYDNCLIPEFSKYYFRSDIHRKYFVKEMNLVIRASLGQELLKKLPVLIPPLSEQQAIADYLDAKCSEIDNLIAKKEQFLKEIETYKKSLIYEYVTGEKEVL